MSNAVERALISVSDKTGIVEFAKALAEQGVEILSTGGTYKKLQDEGIAVREVSDYTGFPEMMAGRVKTLHPKVHGGILGRRGQDEQVMADNDISRIDLVVVNLYPFEATVANPDCSLEDAIENIDIGGPTMVRSAAKNNASVCSTTWLPTTAPCPTPCVSTWPSRRSNIPPPMTAPLPTTLARRWARTMLTSRAPST